MSGTHTSTTRISHQQGTVTRVKRTHCPDVWVFRFRITDEDGQRVQRKRTIGTVVQYPTKAAAKKAIENFRAEINAQPKIGRYTVGEAWGHFQLHELRCIHADRSPTTIILYLDNFRHHIIPQWGDTPLTDVKAVAVEAWLRSLKYAPTTKSKLRNHMSALFNHAIRHELHTGSNPIASVRQSSKRIIVPDILSLEEIIRLLNEITSPEARMMVLVAASTGLRRSEIAGLKWEDFDDQRLWLSLRRGMVRGQLTKLKTETSRKGIPVPRELAAALSEFRHRSLYRAPEDWVFASATVNGRTPLWPDIIMRNHVRPALRRANILKTVGWHTFRRSFASLLAANVADPKVVQELMRHANMSTTMDLYA